MGIQLLGASFETDASGNNEAAIVQIDRDTLDNIRRAINASGHSTTPQGSEIISELRNVRQFMGWR